MSDQLVDIVIVVVVVIVLVVILTWFRSSNKTNQQPVTVDDMTPLISALEQQGENGSFVVFMFETPDNTEETLPNVQYSIENGRLGFDWVLLAPQNIRDEEKIKQWVGNSGYGISKHTMNNVSYLRAEGVGIENLGVKIICDFYKLPPNTPIEMIREGF